MFLGGDQQNNNLCLEGDNIKSKKQVVYCKCGCGQITKISQRTGKPNVYMLGHFTKNQTISDEHKHKIGNANRGNHSNLGHKLTDEHKRKLSAAHKNRPVWNKGISPSKETRNKISNTLKGNIPWNKGLTAGTDIRVKLYSEKVSAANRGRKCTPQAIENMKGHSPWNKGEKNCYTDEALKQMSRSHTGIAQPEYVKRKISNTMKGANNRLWKGGLSFDPYTPEFNNNLKEQIRIRDQYKCQKCFRHQNELHAKNGRKYKLHVHHIDYDKKNSSKSNLICLCMNCHLQTQANREDWTNYYQKIINSNAATLT